MINDLRNSYSNTIFLLFFFYNIIMRKLPYIQTSVFVDDRYQFSGNQLATFWYNEANLKLTTEEMQGIAREMNYSESTFIFNSKFHIER